jgi:hypothetical protein
MRRHPSLLLALLAACAGPEVGPAPGPDDPIAAPAERWTWVGFPAATCGDGTPTGIGVNPSSRSTDVVVYLQGGGACWDGNCVPLSQQGYVALTYGVDQFSREPLLSGAAFDRANPATPWRGASFVFLPYCTADLHAGDAVRDYLWVPTSLTVHHAGRANLAAFLRRLAPTFPGARRIYLVGSSAGGYGAQLDYEQVVAAFPDAEVHLLADGAQLVPPHDPALWATWLSTWDLALPAGCTACATDPGALVTWLSSGHPTRRFGLLASTQDGVLTAYLGYPADGSFEAATQTLLTSRYDPPSNACYFALASTRHTMLGDLSLTSAAGVPLSTWLGRWYSGDAWASTGP